MTQNNHNIANLPKAEFNQLLWNATLQCISEECAWDIHYMTKAERIGWLKRMFNVDFDISNHSKAAVIKELGQ